MATWIPYGRQTIGDDDLRAVAEVLRSDWLTCGPAVPRFEAVVAGFCGAAYGVAVSNGTAALHAAVAALGLGPGDEVIVPPLTFAATANCALYVGARPVFADVDPGTLLLDPAAVERAVSPRTRAVIGVDYAGQPCDWEALHGIAERRGLALVADGCHALGATLGGRRVGALARMTTLSFHPVKHIATGEGGMVLTDDPELDRRLRRFRNHGISTEARQRESAGEWYYEMVELGYNYRLTDIQAALGASQMDRLPEFLERRRAIARFYDQAFAGSAVRPLDKRPGLEHAYHLYVVRVPERDRVFRRMREAGVGVQVHYIPVHLHPYYRSSLGTAEGLCPTAEAAAREILSLPMYPGLSDADVRFVAERLLEAVDG